MIFFLKKNKKKLFKKNPVKFQKFGSDKIHQKRNWRNLFRSSVCAIMRGYCKELNLMTMLNEDYM